LKKLICITGIKNKKGTFHNAPSSQFSQLIK
jgi:hypothetical protein